jgi:hypothetical protein
MAAPLSPRRYFRRSRASILLSRNEFPGSLSEAGVVTSGSHPHDSFDVDFSIKGLS